MEQCAASSVRIARGTAMKMTLARKWRFRWISCRFVKWFQRKSCPKFLWTTEIRYLHCRSLYGLIISLYFFHYFGYTSLSYTISKGTDNLFGRNIKSEFNWNFQVCAVLSDKVIISTRKEKWPLKASITHKYSRFNRNRCKLHKRETSFG